MGTRRKGFGPCKTPVGRAGCSVGKWGSGGRLQPEYQRSHDMVNRTIATIAAAGGLGLASLAGTLGGCDSLPGNKQTQGAVIGGAGGAVAVAAIAKDKPLLGALIGGVLGAGGGY